MQGVLSADSGGFRRIDVDRTGVILSILCAVHCIATPFLLLLLPTFGKIWAHPASHGLVALIVVPLAGVALWRGFRKHRRSWVLASGIAGVALILWGVVIPFQESPIAASEPNEIAEEEFVFHVSEENVEPAAETGEAEFVFHVSEASIDPESAATGCSTNCCPSFTVGADGETKLVFPAASIVTTLGGLALIIAHIGNLCGCANCGKRKHFPA